MKRAGETTIPSSMSTAASSLRFWRRVRRRAVLAGLCVTVAACAAVAWGAMLSRQPPSWWREMDPHDSRVVLMAEELENAVGTHLHLARESAPGLVAGERWRSEPWRVAVRAADADAWLNTRLGPWLASLSNGTAGLPEEVRQVQVEFEDGRVRVGVLVAGSGGSGRGRVISATLRPTLREDGSLWVSAEGLSVGRLPIPAGWVLGGDEPPDARVIPASLWNREGTRAFIDAMRGRRALLEEPTIELMDGRRVRLLALTVRAGRLEVGCRTEGK